MKPNPFKILLICFALFSLCGKIHAQSKKTINAQLKAELVAAKRDYDSLTGEYFKKNQLLESAKTTFKDQQLLPFKRQREELKTGIYRLSSLYERIEKLGEHASEMVNLNEFKEDKWPKFKESTEQSYSLLLERRGFYQIVKDTLDLNDLKIKVQNDLLVKQLRIYADAQESNVKKMDILDQNIAILPIVAKECDSISAGYAKIGEKANDAMFSLNDKLLELKDNYRKKGPKGFSDEYKWQFPDVYPTTKEPIAIGVEMVTSGDSEDRNSVDYEMPPPPQSEMPEPPKQDPEILDVVDEPAEFTGGKSAMLEYMTKNLKYPPIAVENEIQGKCYLKFVVSATGNISNVKLMKGVVDCPECDQEAIRMVKTMPNWKPAKNNGVAVNSWYTLPVQFKLN